MPGQDKQLVLCIGGVRDNKLVEFVGDSFYCPDDETDDHAFNVYPSKPGAEPDLLNLQKYHLRFYERDEGTFAVYAHDKLCPAIVRRVFNRRLLSAPLWLSRRN